MIDNIINNDYQCQTNKAQNILNEVSGYNIFFIFPSICLFVLNIYFHYKYKVMNLLLHSMYIFNFTSHNF